MKIETRKNGTTVDFKNGLLLIGRIFQDKGIGMMFVRLNEKNNICLMFSFNLSKFKFSLKLPYYHGKRFARIVG